MTAERATKYSLADFLYLDSDDPLTTSSEFESWCRDGEWAMALYEPALAHGPTSRTALAAGPQEQPVINLTSYNYLGLGSHPAVTQAAKEAIDEFGTGSCGSPILSGMTVLHRKLEAAMSAFLQREQTMLFNSGFGGAFGIMAGLMRRGDIAVLDNRCHICWVEGAKTAGARIEMFDHNDPDAFDAALAKHDGKRRIAIVEGIYSMDGDMARLNDLAPIARNHGVGLVIDEAHSILAIGEHGRGTTEHFDAEDSVILKYGTFSKAFAGIGGFVSGPESTLRYLRFYANSYSFSCSLAPPTVGGLLAALKVAQEEPERRQRLQANATYFRDQVQGMGFSTGESESQVVPIIIGSDRQWLYESGHLLRNRGLFLAPVDYPSVREDELRFRASITCEHDQDTLDEALNIINDVLRPRLP